MACANPDIVRIGVDVEDFKTLFKRGFNYVPYYDNTAVYNSGDIIYYSINNRFYSCKSDNVSGIIPTNTTYWNFESKITINDYIDDGDIENAFDEACMKFNSSLFYNDEEIKLAYLYLTAHFLVGDVNAGGTQTDSAGFASSRSVGNVSESYTIPEWMQRPQYSFYTTTYYGRKYINMIYSRTRGGVVSVWSGTNA